MGTLTGVIKQDTRSLDYRSNESKTSGVAAFCEQLSATRNPTSSKCPRLTHPCKCPFKAMQASVGAGLLWFSVFWTVRRLGICNDDKILRQLL